jgi:hypothetical protein
LEAASAKRQRGTCCRRWLDDGRKRLELPARRIEAIIDTLKGQLTARG